MSSVRVVIHPAGYNHVFKSRTGPIGKDFERRCELLAAHAREQIGVDSGRAKASIGVDYHKTASGDLAAHIGVNPSGRTVGYAIFHHEGTDAHRIPKRGSTGGPVLRFSAGGATLFRTSVRHPGTKANRFLSDNVRRAFG